MAKKKVSKPATKKSAAKKSVLKKAAVKNPAAKKAAVKKKASSKPVPKKQPAKKSALKKLVPKKTVAKKVITKGSNRKVVAKKKVVFVKNKKPAARPVKISLPLQIVSAEQIISKVPDNELNAAVKTADPLTTFDKHAFEKATAKGDPHSRLQLNNTGKSAIRPSGKKPLWRK